MIIYLNIEFIDQIIRVLYLTAWLLVVVVVVIMIIEINIKFSLELEIKTNKDSIEVKCNKIDDSMMILLFNSIE